ncbi:DNA ligase 3-like isoform X2 [Halichondria panicea]|uniref:DNA ligase 3-like isoform X2 n=1 Tax=Halichondria panicea TaxID=6063 RepID=UPI00312B8E59
MADARYCVEYAKTGRSSCKKCKSQIEKGVCRIGKMTPNPFSDDGGDMKVWYHTRCIFETFKRARATTKKIETPADVDGFPELNDPEKQEIKDLIKECVTSKPPPKTKKAVRTTLTGDTSKSLGKSPSKPSASSAGPSTITPSTPPIPADPSNQDNLFSEFRALCGRLEKEPKYNGKTKLVSDFIKRGSSGDVDHKWMNVHVQYMSIQVNVNCLVLTSVCVSSFNYFPILHVDGYNGDVYLLVKLLLPTAGKKRVYNLQSKQIVKLLSQIFGTSLEDMVEDLEKGDVAETAKTFFLTSSCTPPQSKSALTLAEVDFYLDELTKVTKEDDQRAQLKQVVERCSEEDLKYYVRLLKHDLRIFAGPKHVLDALDPKAYKAFQASNDLQDVVERVLGGGGESSEGGDGRPSLKRGISVRASLMTPVKPMLAEACRAVAMAMKKCPNGMYAEIKYDGERVQVHKQGNKFEYFSRSLKAVQPHKVEHIKDYLSKACPHGDNMILDAEVLMVDTNTGKPLPFGTLGIHKKSAFKDACCCLFIFDIVYFNGETLMDKPLMERRKILEQNIKEVKNRIMLSEQKLIRQEEDLSDLIMKVIKQGLEGLVLKDTKSVYEPGKRHWLKVKKDYLEGGAMADTADLIVLGAYYGTGNKGGMMSVFLMGLYDSSTGKFCTVAKCGNGHDDATIAKLQDELDMVKISKDSSKVPSWLLVNKSVVPDLVIRDPKIAPVWEITGAEFSSSNIHTAGGISIRFPRVTRIRDDKNWSTATDLARLKVLYEKSKEFIDIPDLMTSVAQASGSGGGSDCDTMASPKKTPTKRKLEGNPKPSPKRSKPVCKYGPKCYQANPKHMEEFEHPWDVLTTHKLESAGLKIEKPLLDIFTGVKVYILPNTLNSLQLERYFTAYDGEVLDEHQKSLATYIIGNETPKDSGDIKCLKSDWIWDSLEQKTQLPVENYLHTM